MLPTSKHGLTRCPSCRNHVHATADTCEHCGAALETPETGEAPRRLPGRGGMVAAGLLALASVNCSGDTGTEQETPPADTTGSEDPVEEPGEPPPDENGGTVGEPEDPIAVPAYGVAPPPSQDEVSRPEPDDPVEQPLYGIAPEQIEE